MEDDQFGRCSLQFAVADSPEEIFIFVADESHVQDAVAVEERRVQFGRARVHPVAIPIQTAPTVDDSVSGDDDVRLDDKIAVAQDHGVAEMPVISSVAAAFSVETVIHREMVRIVERRFDPAKSRGASLHIVAMDSGSLEIGDDGAVVGDRHPRDGIHDAVAQVIADDAFVKNAAAGSHHVVVLAMADGLHVVVPVSAEKRVVDGIDVAFEGEPLIAGPVDRHVHENERPTCIGVVADGLPCPCVLFVRDALDGHPSVASVHRVQADEMAVLVHEIIVRFAAMPFHPDAFGDIMREMVAGPAQIDVMVADDIVEPHVELVDEILQLVPFVVHAFFRMLFRGGAIASFHEIADADGEFRPQKIQRLHGFAERPFAFTAGPVGDDGEMEILRVIQQWLVRIGQDGLGIGRCLHIV